MSNKEKVASRYNRWTRFYDAIDNFPIVSRPQRKWREAAVDALELEGDEVVLDVGAGSGQMLTMIAKRLEDGKAIGTDISEGMIRVTSRRIEREKLGERAEALKDDIEDSSFPDDYFDRIIATFTFTTIPDPVSAARECARILKPEGKMIVLDTGKPDKIYVQPLFIPMMLSARLFGRTHMDRDIEGILEGRFKVKRQTDNLLGMVYLLKCEPLDQYV